MEYTIAMGVWAVTVAAPCLASWLAGDFNGAARTRRAFETSFTGTETAGTDAARTETGAGRIGPRRFAPALSTSLDSLSAETRDGWPATGPATGPAASSAAPERAPSTIEEQVRQAEARHRQRRALMPGGSLRGEPETASADNQGGALAGSPDLAPDLATATAALADEPAIDRVLRHYERSIRALEEARAAREAQGWAMTDRDAVAQDSAAMLTQMPQWHPALKRAN